MCVTISLVSSPWGGGGGVREKMAGGSGAGNETMLPFVSDIVTIICILLLLLSL